MRTSRILVYALALLFFAALLWLHGQHLLFYRRTVLEAPIRFEEGFSFTRQFTIDTSTLYWVAIRYDEIFRNTVEMPVPRDEFTAEFEITSQDRVIAKGGTASAPDWSGGGPAPWSSNKNQVTRYLDSFGEGYKELAETNGLYIRLRSSSTLTKSESGHLTIPNGNRLAVFAHYDAKH